MDDKANVHEYRFEDNGRIPNNQALPLLVYPRTLDESEWEPSGCKELSARRRRCR